jgi:integrase
VLTGFREREALNLRWDELDLTSGMATLRDTKTGRSERHLGDAALALLMKLHAHRCSPYVFPGRSPERPLQEINRVWYAVRHAAGLDGVRLHDIRHTYASLLVNSGSSLPITGRVLGHRNPATTARYAHFADTTVHAAANLASGAADRLLTAGIASTVDSTPTTLSSS